MVQCEICKREFNNYNGLAKHIFRSHKEISSEEYYNKYIAETNPICYCGNKKKFRNIRVGYLTYCSPHCNCNDPDKKEERVKKNKNRKQNKNQINKRIQNTDQKLKESKRRNTCLERYGVVNTSKLDSVKSKISNTLSGRSCPRTTEHQAKIIASKFLNGTTKLSEESKIKIKESLRKLYDSENAPQIEIQKKIIQFKNGYSTGYVNGIFHRSSYEKRFLEYCFKNNIRVISAENKDFRVRYTDSNNINRWYYPDFYLKDYDTIIEIKPETMISYKDNIRKMLSMIEQHNLCLITEEELEDLDKFFENLPVL